MAFTELVDWINGETVSSLKLNSMRDNDEFVREEANYVYIMNGNEIASISGGDSNGPSSLDIDTNVYIDGTAYGAGDTKTLSSNSSGVDSIVLADQDISAISSGIHDLTIKVTATGGTDALYEASIKIYITTDMDYLTLWLDRAYSRTTPLNIVYTYGLENYITIIGHREAKLWT